MFTCKPIDMSFYETASQRFVFERELATNPNQLFDVFEDEHSWPQWAPGIARVTWTSERPFGVGTTRTVQFIGGMEVYEDFIAWERGKQMAFGFTGTTQRVWWAFGENYEVTDLGNNRCKLKWTVAYEPRFVFKTIHRAVKPAMQFALGQYAANLGKYVKNLTVNTSSDPQTVQAS